MMEIFHKSRVFWHISMADTVLLMIFGQMGWDIGQMLLLKICTKWDFIQQTWRWKRKKMSESHLILCHRLLKNLPITKKRKKTLCWWTKKTGKERKWQIFPKELFDMLTKEMLKICSMLLRTRRDFTAKHFILVGKMVVFVQKI